MKGIISQNHSRILWTSPVVVVLLFAAAGFLSVSAVKIALRAGEIRNERLALEAKVRELEARKRELEATLLTIDSRDAVERAAKEKLNLKNPGEKVVVVEPDRATSTGKGASGFAGFLPGWLTHLLQFFER